MKKGIILICLTILFLSSCSKDSNQGFETKLEGVWLLQNISTGSKLTFESKNFTIQSGTVTIIGTFELNNNQMSGQVVSRSGAHNEGLQPDTFTGNVEIWNNKVTFTDFSGNWRGVFSTWYQKQ